MIYLSGFAVPLALFFTGMLGKKLVRGKGWQPNDFFLGVEVTLRALTSGLLHIFDLTKQISIASQNLATPLANPVSADRNNLAIANNLTTTAVFTAITFFLFLVAISVRQDWEHKRNGRPKFLALGMLCNLIGFILMIAFLPGVKGVH